MSLQTATRPSEALLAHFAELHRMLTMRSTWTGLMPSSRLVLTGSARAAFFIHNVRGRQWDFLGVRVVRALEAMVGQTVVGVHKMEVRGADVDLRALKLFAATCAATGLFCEIHARIAKGMYSWERMQRLASLGAVQRLLWDIDEQVKAHDGGQRTAMVDATRGFLEHVVEAVARAVEQEGEAERSGDEAAMRRRVPGQWPQLRRFEGADEAWRVAAGLLVEEMEERTDGMVGV